MKVLKKDFLPVPDFLNYEINGFLKLRNIKTGKFLKLHRKKTYGKIYPIYELTRDKKRYERRPELLYQQALTALEYGGSQWIPLKSLKFLYEINAEGILRNSKTKNLIAPQKRQQHWEYCVKIGDKKTNKSVNLLLAEAFGKYHCPNNSKPCRVFKGSSAWHFDSLSAAARYLAPRVFYTEDTLLHYLSKRPKELFGYQFVYLGG